MSPHSDRGLIVFCHDSQVSFDSQLSSQPPSPPLGSSDVTCAHVPLGACECPQPTTAMCGTITDGTASFTYPTLATCKWLIAVPNGVNGVIELTFTSFDTEAGFDFVTISRCTTAKCSLLGSMVQEVEKLSGNTLNLATVYSMGTSEWKFLQVVLTSDDMASSNSGFDASWVIRVIITVSTPLTGSGFDSLWSQPQDRPPSPNTIVEMILRLPLQKTAFTIQKQSVFRSAVAEENVSIVLLCRKRM